MEISTVRKRVNDTIERAKRRAAERRTRTDEAGVVFGRLLEGTAVPLFRQIVNVLRSEGYQFNLFTPPGSVRLTSDRRGEDYVEVLLDSSGESPQLMLHSSRSHGSGVVESERAIGEPSAVSEEDILAAVMDGLAPLVER